MKAFIFSFILFLSGASAFSQASEIYKKNGVAIEGYDAVAFFTEHKPVQGDKQYTYEWKDAAWRFASQQNLDSFKVAPEKYAPQYGGYCAFGTAAGHKSPTQIDTWSVINDKLYFNYNMKVKEMWIKDTTLNIEKADKNWQEIKSKEQ